MLVVHFSLLFGCPRAMAVLPCGDWIALSFLRIVGNLFTLHSQFVVSSTNCGSYALRRGLLDCCSYFNSWNFVQRATAALCDLFNVQGVFLQATVDWLQALKCWIVT